MLCHGEEMYQTQYIETFTSAYTKGYALNWVLTIDYKNDISIKFWFGEDWHAFDTDIRQKEERMLSYRY